MRVRYVQSLDELGEPHAIILPGSKSTIADLQFLELRGFSAAIRAHAHRGAAVIGICGGYQMLGRVIRDPDRVESERASVEGLGLLDVETIFLNEKATHQARARIVASSGFFRYLAGQEISGYEIHMGKTRGADAAFQITQRGDNRADDADGAVDATGRVFGTYLHGLFDNANFRRAFLMSLRALKGRSNLQVTGDCFVAEIAPRNDMHDIREREYDRLADHVRAHLELAQIRCIVGV